MKRVACLLALAAATAGCATTPDEIDRIRTENELLREQIQIIKQNCSYYRDLEIEPEESQP